MISRKKAQFKDYRTRMQMSRIEAETAKLEAEKLRQAELAKVTAKKQRVQRDVDNISSYNKKQRGPSGLQKLGQGLARTMNKASEAKKNAQSQGFLKGVNLGNEGSKGINFEGKGSPFNK